MVIIHGLHTHTLAKASLCGGLRCRSSLLISIMSRISVFQITPRIKSLIKNATEMKLELAWRLFKSAARQAERDWKSTHEILTHRFGEEMADEIIDVVEMDVTERS